MHWTLYQLSRDTPESFWPKFLEKCVEKGEKAQLWSSHTDTLISWDKKLWTYRPDSFLPHGMDDPEQQPILLSSSLTHAETHPLLCLLELPQNFQELFNTGYTHIIGAFPSESPHCLAFQVFLKNLNEASSFDLWKQSFDGRWTKE